MTELKNMWKFMGFVWLINKKVIEDNLIIAYAWVVFLEKAMAPHSSTLAWRIPWAEEPGRLQSMRSLRVGHDWATSLSLFTFLHWRRKWQPTPVFLPGESQGWGAWWAAVYGVAQSRTLLLAVVATEWCFDEFSVLRRLIRYQHIHLIN